MISASEKRILIVDDEPDVLIFLSACLEDAGFEVEGAVDGVDALEKIDDFSPDLMTLDLNMPRMSGIKVMRALRKNEKWAKLPIIVITAHAHDELGGEQIEEFMASTSNVSPRRTLEKPLSPENIVKVICEILDVTPATVEEVTDERSKIMNLVNETDPETLRKIGEMLNKK